MTLNAIHAIKYLIQIKPKWNTASNLANNDTIVLLIIDIVPRLKWSLGMIDDVFPFKDGVAHVMSVRTNSGEGFSFTFGLSLYIFFYLPTMFAFCNISLNHFYFI